jgi:hypothetical protein
MKFSKAKILAEKEKMPTAGFNLINHSGVITVS